MVKNHLDAEKAAAELKPDLSPLGVAQTATKLENDPRVQRAVQKELQKRSLDKDSRDHFVELLWRYAESEDQIDEKRQLQAMRILGKAFISESVEVTQPAVLRLRGFDEEIKQMFDGTILGIPSLTLTLEEILQYATVPPEPGRPTTRQTHYDL